jgi:hypothetical protein
MSSPMVASLNSISQQINIYFGVTILVAGVIGGLLNVVIFLSLRTFRESPCGFYLIIMSIVNIGQLFTGLLSRVMLSGFGIDWTQNSLFYCKTRLLIFQLCTLISYTCLCLATIDQYFATCSHPRWQEWSNFKLARRLITGTTLLWILHAIPYAIFFDHVHSPTTQAVSCVTTNGVFIQYRAYFVGLILIGWLPVVISVFFGILAYQNVKQLTYRTVPLVRRELDKQLTTMVLVQVVVNFFSNIPFVIMNAVTLNSSITNDAVIWARIQFAFAITLLFFYSYFAVSKDPLLTDGERLENIASFSSLEPILYLRMCVGTISSSIELCLVRRGLDSLAYSAHRCQSSQPRR